MSFIQTYPVRDAVQMEMESESSRLFDPIAVIAVLSLSSIFWVAIGIAIGIWIGG